MKKSLVRIVCLILVLALAAELSACAASAAGEQGISREEAGAEIKQPPAGGASVLKPSSGAVQDDREQSAEFQARYFRVSWKERSGGPNCYLFTDSASLSAYYLAQKSDRPEEAKEDISRYDDAWFSEHQLIVAVIDEGSGSTRHEVGSVIKSADGGKVVIARLIPEIGTCDMASWRIFIEVGKVFSAGCKIDIQIVSKPMSGSW